MIAILLAVVVAQAQAAAPPTGAVRVHVIDKETGRPLPRAVIRLAGNDGAAGMLTMIADERGTFTFDGLAPGRYTGLVTARQHAEESFPARSAPLSIEANQTVDVTVALLRTHAINVRVVDAFGDPLSRISVVARSLDGGRAPIPSHGRGTDDLGRLRVFDFPPGRYVLCAETSFLGFSSTTPGRSERLQRTCYPSNDEENAEPIRVGQSDVDGVEIRMRRGRAFAISGTVVDAGGGSAPGAMLHISRFAVGRVTSSPVQVDANGGFKIFNVQPGGYAIQGSTANAAAFVEVRVEDSDVDNLIVAFRKTVDVQGRVVPDDPTATLPPAQGSGFMIEARLQGDHLPGMGSGLFTFARHDRTFTLERLFGPRVVTFTNAPRGWYVKSVRYDGREIIDTPTEFKGGAGAPTLDVVLGNRGASVTGTAVDDGGRPASAFVYMLREKAAGGIDIAAFASTASDGAFTIGPARGGDYVLVAVLRLPSSEILSSSDQDRLTRLASLGERLTLTDLDERTIQLHIVRER